MQKEVLLVTLNSTYQHCAFGLRYLYANLGDLQSRAQILEWTIQANPRNVVEKILSFQPKIVGFGVYIWNTMEIHEVVSILKRVAPEVIVVLGGPEVSHESETQRLCQAADYVIKGEADFLFREFCEQILVKQEQPAQKFIAGGLPEITRIASPYSYYSDEDIKNRILYVEVSRGCPYKCEYCLSSLDKLVRSFELESFLVDIDRLITRGARQFKFVDRTFNLSIQTSTRILQFFLERVELGLFLHFEMVPDRLPPELKELIKKFPAGVLQFEVGIQTWNSEVAKNVSRRNDYTKVRENFHFLSETGVHTHADLIVGLPGEDLTSFAVGFDELSSVGPHEIQVGILKRLKGTPIVRHDREWEMVYQEHPPFQILRNKSINYVEMQKMNRFAKFWDSIANSGHFSHTTAWLRQRAGQSEKKSFFWEFYKLSEFLSARYPESHGISLQSLLESLWVYLTEELQVEKTFARDLLLQDYMKDKPRNIPNFLKEGLDVTAHQLFSQQKNKTSALPERQQRHLKQ